MLWSCSREVSRDAGGVEAGRGRRRFETGKSVPNVPVRMDGKGRDGLWTSEEGGVEMTGGQPLRAQLTPMAKNKVSAMLLK